MRQNRRSTYRHTVVTLAVLASVVIAAPTAQAVPSERQERCLVRADAYAAAPHPGLTPAEVQERTDWLYAQASYNYTNSDSDIILRDYDRNRISVGMRAEF